MSARELPAGTALMLPEERHAVIKELHAVAPRLDAEPRALLERLVQAAAGESELEAQLVRESREAVARLLAHLIGHAAQGAAKGAVLELLVMLMRLDDHDVAGAVAEAVEKLKADEGRDPLETLHHWAKAAEGKDVFRAMEAFALLLASAPQGVVDAWLRQLLQAVRSALSSAAQPDADENDAALSARVEGAVRALSILAGPIHLRLPLVLSSNPDDLSTPALLPALLFPEGKFASKMQENSQLVYDAAKTLWKLSFTGEVLDHLDKQCRKHATVKGHTLIGVLNNLLRKQKKEKIIRMVLNVLANYVARHKQHAPDLRNPSVPNYVKDMISVGMLRNLEMLQKRTFSTIPEADIPSALEAMVELLEVHVDDLSSYAIYAQEVNSAVLEWSPAHTSEKFWRESVKAFEQDNFATIKELAKIITRSQVPLYVQIACHDMGEFVRTHPQGKRVFAMLEIKNRIYDLIERGLGETPQDRDAVKRHALLCMQKILVQRWDMIEH